MTLEREEGVEEPDDDSTSHDIEPRFDPSYISDSSLRERVSRDFQRQHDRGYNAAVKKAQDAARGRVKQLELRVAELEQRGDEDTTFEEEMRPKSTDVEQVEGAPLSDDDLREFEEILLEFPNVSDTRVNEIFAQANGSSKRFANLLAREERETDKRVFQEELADENEADMTELAARRRDDKPKTVSEISANRKAKPVRKATTDDELIDQYNAGDLAFTELPPEVQKRVS